jgi:hypothetical protein
LYVAELHGDGRVVYHGLAFVGDAGLREASIDPQVVANLLDHLYDILFFDASADYRNPTFADGYPAAVAVRIGDYEKRSMLDWPAPDEIDALPQLIYELSGIDRWVNVMRDP